MLRLLFPLFFLLTGCASLDDVVGGIANTPEWFQDRRVEIRGQGYPDFANVPDEQRVKPLQQSLEQSETDVRALYEAFINDPRAQPANISTDDIADLTDNLNAQLQTDAPRQDELLTDRDIAEIRKKLRAPPVKN